MLGRTESLVRFSWVGAFFLVPPSVLMGQPEGCSPYPRALLGRQLGSAAWGSTQSHTQT